MESVAAARPPSPHGDVRSGRDLHAGEPGLAEAGVAFGQCVIVYYGIAFLLHYVVPAVVATRNVQRAKQRHPDTMRDASRSLIPLLIKSYTLFAAEWLHYKGYGVMDNRGLAEVAKSPSGLLQVLAMVALLDLFHDTWFYFTHRLLHSRWMLRNVHYMHHQSTNPSAFTGYSFHWCVVVIPNKLLMCFPPAFLQAILLTLRAQDRGGHGFQRRRCGDFHFSDPTRSSPRV